MSYPYYVELALEGGFQVERLNASGDALRVGPVARERAYADRRCEQLNRDFRHWFGLALTGSATDPKAAGPGIVVERAEGIALRATELLDAGVDA